MPTNSYPSEHIPYSVYVQSLYAFTPLIEVFTFSSSPSALSPFQISRKAAKAQRKNGDLEQMTEYFSDRSQQRKQRLFLVSFVGFCNIKAIIPQPSIFRPLLTAHCFPLTSSNFPPSDLLIFWSSDLLIFSSSHLLSSSSALVPHVWRLIIPFPARVRVKHLGIIHIKVRLRENTEIAVITGFPQVPVVMPGQWPAVHADMTLMLPITST